jgi:DNA polymerase-3 subunit alpha
MQALEQLDKDGITQLARLGNAEDAEELVGKVHTFAALVMGTRKVTTKKGDTMMVLQLEDESGGPYDLVAFPKSYEKFKELLQPEALLMIQAKVERDRRGEGVQLLLEGASMLDASGARLKPPVDAHADIESVAPRTPIDNRAMHDPGLPGGEEPPLPDTPAELHVVVAPAGAAPAPTLPSETLSIIRPRSRIAMTNGTAIQGNGGNGPAQDNGHSSAETVHRRSLLLQLPNCEYERGVQLMQAVRSLLEQRIAGDQGDQVIIKLPRASGTVILKPRDTVQCTGDMLDQLRAILGAHAVMVE